MKPDETLMSDKHSTILLPRIERRIQVIRGLRFMLDVDLPALEVVANCDYLRNLTAPPESLIKRRMAQLAQC